AMALTNLESMKDFIEINSRNYIQYQEELGGINGIELQSYDPAENCNYQYVVLTIDEEKTTISRDQLIEVLYAENVLARRYFYPACHRMEPYRSFFPHAGLLLPETEKLTNRVLCLPTGTGVNGSQIGLVCRILRLAVENGSGIAARLSIRKPARLIDR